MRAVVAAAGCVWAIALGSAAFAASRPSDAATHPRASAPLVPLAHFAAAAPRVSRTAGAGAAQSLEKRTTGRAEERKASLEEITAKLRESYSGVRGFSMSFEQTNSWVDMPESGEVSRGKLWAADGNRLRMEYSDPKGHLLVCDGTRVWVYVPENRQAVVDSLRGGEHAALGKMIMNLLGSGDAKVVGREEVRGVSCYAVTVTEVSEPPGLDSVKIWIDPELWLARALRLTDLNENVTTFVFWKIKRLWKVDEDLFAFEAPPGVEIVESPLGEGRSE